MTALVNRSRDASLPPDEGTLRAEPLHIGVVGAALSTLLVLTYVLCVGALALARTHPIAQQVVSMLLPPLPVPGLRGFGIGLARAVAWSWYIAIVFCPIHNFYARQVRQ